MTEPEQRFTWVRFYEEFANKLLEYKDRRELLVTAVQNALVEVKSTARFDETDICPFTVMALMNRGNSKWRNRITIAESLSRSLELVLEPPADFHGVPVLQSQQWWFFDYEIGRAPEDIDSLWQVFEDALKLHETDNDRTRAAFATSFDAALKVKKTGLTSLTMGLYWVRPNRFVALDEKNTQYIGRHFPELRGKRNPKDGWEYMALCDDIGQVLQRPETQASTIPEFSRFADMESRTLETLVEEESKRQAESDQVEVSGQPEDRRVQAGAIAIRQGQSGFRKKLLKAYDGRCAITGYDVKNALDACHIKTFPGKDDNSESNGLLLRADIHNLFDAHLLGVDPDTGKVWISKKLKGTKYAQLDGKQALLPENPKHHPNADALRERWEEAKKLGRVS